MRRSLIAAAIAFGAVAPAAADVELELIMKGYSELFKECEFSIDVYTSNGDYSAVSFGYSVPIEGKGVKECEASISTTESLTTNCRAPNEFYYNCEEFEHIRLQWMNCYGDDGGGTPCDNVSLTAPEAGMFRFPDE